MIPTLGVHKFTEEEQKQNQIYFDIIKDAIDNYEVKNFAITGAYGTGKSTIIQNFFRLYPTETEDYTHAIVSLSSFCATSTPSAKEDKEPKKEETSSPKEENKEREENKTKESRASSSTSSHKPSLAELEMSILQQLFYQIDEKKLRFSRFQRKTKISTSNKIFTFIVSLGCVITLFAFSYKDTFSKYLSSISQLFILGKEDTILFNIIKGIGLFIPALILTIGAYILFERLYYGIYKGHWKKLQFNLGKIQSEHQITGSIINDNLHDILVFFHNAELDVVVFEDIDRLDNAMEIFTKLRELNETINRSHEFQSIKKKVLFIYALKDDILPTPEARTKFFDLIMPIVPLVSSDNSYNLFSQELKEIAKKYPQKDFIPINECISDEMLYTVSPYLSDIRSIRNIVTEFYIQWKLLIEKQWRNEFKKYPNDLSILIKTESQQLFALLIFKHFSPSDYQLASKGDGLLHYIFNEFKSQVLLKKNNNSLNLNSYNSIYTFELSGLDLLEIKYSKKTKNTLLIELTINMINHNYINENYATFLYTPKIDNLTQDEIIFCKKANARYSQSLINVPIKNASIVLERLKFCIFFTQNEYDVFSFNKDLIKYIIKNQSNTSSDNWDTISAYTHNFIQAINFTNLEIKMYGITLKFQRTDNYLRLKELLLSFSEEEVVYLKYILNLIFRNKYIHESNSYTIARLLYDNDSQSILFSIIITHECFQEILSEPVLLAIQRISNYTTIKLTKKDDIRLFEFCHKNNLTLKDPIYQKKLEEYRLKYQKDKTTYLEDS